MGVRQCFVLLLVPFTVWCHLPGPSPPLPGLGPLPDAPPPLIPIDHQRCVAMRRETSQIQMPVPYFCHPQDKEGIPIPPFIDPKVAMMLTRLQWSGYKVCTKNVPMPTHRYVPVPVCCPGWKRGPTGKCDMPVNMPSLRPIPCLNGGVFIKNRRCCHCPPGFAGQFCQNRIPFPKMGRPPIPYTRLGSAMKRPGPQRSHFMGPGPRNPMRFMRNRMSSTGNGQPMNPQLVRFLLEKNSRSMAPRPLGNGMEGDVSVSIAYINQLPNRQMGPRKPAVNIAYINQLQRNRPRPGIDIPINTAYINKVPMPALKIPVNTAYINQLPRMDQMPRMRPFRPTPNIAYINKVMPPRPGMGMVPMHPAMINRLNRPDGGMIRPLVNVHGINPVPPPRMNGMGPMPIPPNFPRPVMAPPVFMPPREGIPMGINPGAINPVDLPLNSDQPIEDENSVDQTQEEDGIQVSVEDIPDLPIQPMRPQPMLNEAEQCQRILEVGITRCFRNVGILATPSDVFNPENPIVARRICSEGRRLRPCIMAGEMACGRGMKVIITRRMLSSILNALGNLCSSPEVGLGPMQPELPSIPSRLDPSQEPDQEGPSQHDEPQLDDHPHPHPHNHVHAHGDHVHSHPHSDHTHTHDHVGDGPVRIPIRACYNGGVAVIREGQKFCECRQGFAGDLCEIAVCEPMCQNQGRCEVAYGIPTCACADGYYGDQCQNVVDMTTVEEPKPVDPATSIDTSPNPISQRLDNEVNPSVKHQPHEALDQEVHKEKLAVFGYPLWFILAIALGIFVFLFMVCLTCCLCIKCHKSKRSFDLPPSEIVKIPSPENVYTVGVVHSVYETKGIPPLSYEEVKGETIKGLAKQLEVEEEEEVKKEEGK